MNMPWFESSLTRLEARLRTLVEGVPAVDGLSPRYHKQLARALIKAMHSSLDKKTARDEHDGRERNAPDCYTLVLPTQQAQLLLSHPAELDRLTEVLKASATQSGMVFAVEPVLRVVAAPEAAEMKVLVEYSQEGLGDSHTTKVDGRLDANRSVGEAIPRAFLIVNGLTTYPLTSPVVNIGRDPSNQVLLEDTRVSRMHAQLRLIQGRFVIFDLDSIGGTFVNDVAVSSHILNPGDVIRLAGVPLVYGLEEDMPTGFTQELPAEPPTPEVL